MTLSRDVNCARQEQRAATKPVIVTTPAPANTLSEMPDVTALYGIRAEDLRYEVFCPNCARVELASTSDMFKHKCNCGYGVSVEMLRTSPN
jgi:hypothetical protein